MFSQDVTYSTNTNLPAVKSSSTSAPLVLKRSVSWRSGHMVQTGKRSGKVNLEKLRRWKSFNETDDPYETSVTLESITDLENKADNENSLLPSQLLYQEVH